MPILKNYCLLLLLSFTTFYSGFAQQDSLARFRDTSFTNKKSSSVTIAKSFKPYIIPTVLIGYGALSLEVKPFKNLNHSIQHQIVTNNPDFSTKTDEYLWLVPTAAVYGLNAVGIEGKNNLRDRTVIVLIANVISQGGSQVTKRIIHETRPDLSDNQSFPSGHTAAAFTAAEFLYQEYKDVSPWIGIGGYAVAGATGVLRMYNNQHYLGDVLAGAGIGILSTKIAYTIYPFVAKHLFKNYSFKTVAIPSYSQGYPGFSMVHHFN